MATRVRFDIWAKERERADVLTNGLRVLRDTSDPNRPVAKLWQPKATKPTWNYAFRSVDQMEKHIAESAANYDAAQKRKAEYKVQRATGDASKADPGAIFCNSWGWEQTNVDYWQVTERHGLIVVVAKIAQATIAGSEGFMSERVKPVKDHFLLKCVQCGGYKDWAVHYEQCGAFEHKFDGKRITLKKRISFYNGDPILSFEFGSGSLVSPDSEHYQSHYA